MGVAYYLDQAARAHSVGADTAAITMFRSAAEWLLEDQGFKKKMLGPKLQQLQDAVEANTVPRWKSEAHKVLGVLKDLGNTATHTNSGDLSHQAHFDSEFYSHVHAAFEYLLEIVYEAPARRDALLQKLRQPLQRPEQTSQ